MFSAGQPDPATLLDLGTVTDEAASSSRFASCVAITVAI